MNIFASVCVCGNVFVCEYILASNRFESVSEYSSKYNDFAKECFYNTCSYNTCSRRLLPIS